MIWKLKGIRENSYLYIDKILSWCKSKNKTEPGDIIEQCELTCDGWPTVSVKETELISLQVDVYPNPSSGNLNIESYGKEIQSIAVYNLSGVMVYQNTQPNASNLNLNHLPDGMYLMQVKVNDQLSNHQIIISK